MFVDILAERRFCYGAPWKPVSSHQVQLGGEPLEVPLSGRSLQFIVEEEKYPTVETMQRVPLVTVSLLRGEAVPVVLGGFPGTYIEDKVTSLPTPFGNPGLRTNRPWVELTLGRQWFGGGKRVRVINHGAVPVMRETPEEDLGFWKARLAPIEAELGIACL